MMCGAEIRNFWAPSEAEVFSTQVRARSHSQQRQLDPCIVSGLRWGKKANIRVTDPLA